MVKRLIKSDSESQPYYIFNAGNSQGFVIVSGDTRTSKILGYSDKGCIDLNNIPPQLAAILDDYALQIQTIDNEAPQEESWNTKQMASDISGGVLLPTAEWDQNDPYNRMTPNYDGQTMTGCVATAMAIVMKYHNWPEYGTGSYGGVDFGSTHYNWDLMTPTYDESSTEAECNEVAKLMYHCGVAVNMKYGVTQSAAFFDNVAPALTNYFGYKGVLTADRNNYNTSTWEDLIYNELSENRPVLYTGGIHAFVCDGYDGNGYFHFNFGWGGSANGYFKLFAIRVYENIGIGGGSGDYSSGMRIIYGIEHPSVGKHIPLSIVGQRDYGLYLYDNEDKTFGVWSSKVTNAGDKEVSIEAGWEIVPIIEGDSQFIVTETKSFAAQYNDNYGCEINLSALPAFPEGEYHLYPAYRVVGTQKIMHVPMASNRYQYIKMSSTSSGNTFSLPSVSPVINAKVTPVHELFCACRADFDVEISVSEYEFSDDIYLVLRKTDGSRTWKSLRVISLMAGKSTQFTWTNILSSHLTPGEYTLTLEANAVPVYQTTVTLQDAPTVSVLELTEPVKIKNQGNVSSDDFEATFTLRCSGGTFVGDLEACCFPYSGGARISENYLSVPFIIMKDGEEKTFTFTTKLKAERGTVGTLDIYTVVSNNAVGIPVTPEEYSRTEFLVNPEFYFSIDDSERFPDHVFREYLHSIDWLNDGYISDYEMDKVSTLTMNNCNLTSLKGIEYFKNLYRLECYDNNLQELDVTNNKELYDLRCYNNKLQQLDLSQNVKLWNLICQDNKLDTLALENNPVLESVACGNNPLKELRISNAPKLSWLSCESCELKNFAFGELPMLGDLFAESNPLDDINNFDFDLLPALKSFRLENSNVTTFTPKGSLLKSVSIIDNAEIVNIDLSGYTNLEQVVVYNCPKITALPIRNRTLTYFSTAGNYNLSHVDVSQCINLTYFHCGACPLFMLDLSKNTALEEVHYSPKRLYVELDGNGCLDLSKWGKFGFNASNMKNLTNAELSDSLLKFNDNLVRYDYSTGNSLLPTILVELYGKNLGAVDSIEDDAKTISVKVHGREMIISGNDNQPVFIYNVAGQCLFSQQTDRYTAPSPGLYIVKVGVYSTVISIR